jgi:hypothetical protein
MPRYLQLKHSTPKAEKFIGEFEGNLDDLVNGKKGSLPAGVAITAIANLNFHGQDIPAAIFSRIDYAGRFGQDERSVLREVFGRIEGGKASIDKPVRTEIGNFVIQYNFIRGYRPRREARKDDTALDTPIKFDERSKPQGFNYTLPDIELEQFSHRDLDGVQVDFLFNRYPFAPGHFLFVPNRKPQDLRQMHNQYLVPDADAALLESAWNFVVSGEYGDGVRLAYNSLGAHASANHLHFQGFFLTSDWEPPFEQVARDHGDSSGRMKCYFPDAMWITKSDGLSSMREFITEINAKWAEGINAGKTPGENVAYNLYLTPNGVACFPRRHQGNQKYFALLESSPFTTGYAFFEMLGEIISPTADISIFGQNKIERQIRDLYTALSLEQANSAR